MAPSSVEQTAKVFHNGRIITLDPSLPQGEAMYIVGDRIAAIGKNKDISAWSSRHSKSVDLGGQVVIPGFNDSHMHLLNWGQGMDGVDLVAARSVDEVIRLGKEYVQNNRHLDWVVGRGWNDEIFLKKAPPTKYDLDQISPSRPVVLIRVCGHVCVANSMALEMAGISAHTPDPPGGSIDRVDGTGEPTGILRENATDLVRALIPKPTIADLKRMILRAAQAAAALGLTTAQSNDLEGATTLAMRIEAYRQLAEAGELPIRVNLQATMPSPDDLTAYLEVRRSYSGLDHHLTLGPLKPYADGSLGARTAALTYPYADAPNISGMTIYTQAELDELVWLAAKANLQVAVHAIGDRALDMVLASYARAKGLVPHWTARPRIVHCQITRREQLAPMAALGVVADIQPIFVPTDLHFAEERIDTSRAAHAYAWKTMKQMGVHTAGGSDCPVESCNPLWGMHGAITRQDRLGNPSRGWHPQECLTPMEALALFTRDSAYAAHEETLKGSVTPGKLADFVLLPVDPTQVAPEELLSLEITATYVGGRQVWP